MQHTRFSWFRSIFVGIVLLLATFPTASAQDSDAYLNYNDLTSALQALARSHPALATLSSIGTSAEGRSVWLLRLAQGSDPENRPALFIAANLEGNQLVGSQIALGLARELLASASVDSVREVLASKTIYIVPRANPDGAEHYFSAVSTGARTNTTPRDDDNDGRLDEDGPEDLNGDGIISLMRVKDPSGEYRLDASDSRLLVKADATKGEAGGYTVYFEGIDNDTDGFINEDPAGGVDLNRNFQHAYPYYEFGAGPHMVSEPESQAIMDFLISHRSIAAFLTFGESDNLITATNRKGEIEKASGIEMVDFAWSSIQEAKTVGMFPLPRTFGRPAAAPDDSSPRRPPRKPSVTVDSDDLPYFTEVSEQYKKITGIKESPPLRDPKGALFQYGYFQFGVPSFSTPGWGMELPSDSTRNSGRSGNGSTPASFDAKLVSWLDGNVPDGFTDWTPFDHPDLGSVEIGGFHPYRAFNPPAEKIADLSKKHASFALYLTGLFPKVRIAETSVVNHGGGIFGIKVEVENAGLLPTSLAHGVTSRSVRPTMVQLDVAPEAVITGDAKTSFFSSLEGPLRRQKYEWLIRGKRGDTVNVRLVSEKGGSDQKTLELK